METAVKEKVTISKCPKCSGPLISEHGEEPYCLMHGTVRSKPISEPISDRIHRNPKQAALTSALAAIATGAAVPQPPGPTDPPLPPRPAVENKYTMHKYYEDNKDLIILDYGTLGLQTAVKWSINKSTLRTLLNRWKVRIIQRKAGATKRSVKQDKPAVLPSPAAAPVRSHLPELPDYNSAWPVELQGKWLQIYEKLINS
jgi:hypothetical protein